MSDDARDATINAVAAEDFLFEVAKVLWGFHEEAASWSHRPEDIRRLFIDANAAHAFAKKLHDAGWLKDPADRVLTPSDAAVPLGGMLHELIAWLADNHDGIDNYFPWKWEAYTDDCQRTEGIVLGGITTPNGKLPDGRQATYWHIAGDIWEPTGLLICEAVNAAVESFRSAVRARRAAVGGSVPADPPEACTCAIGTRSDGLQMRATNPTCPTHSGPSDDRADREAPVRPREGRRQRAGGLS